MRATVPTATAIRCSRASVEPRVRAHDKGETMCRKIRGRGGERRAIESTVPLRGRPPALPQLVPPPNCVVALR